MPRRLETAIESMRVLQRQDEIGRTSLLPALADFASAMRAAQHGFTGPTRPATELRLTVGREQQHVPHIHVGHAIATASTKPINRLANTPDCMLEDQGVAGKRNTVLNCQPTAT